MDASPGILWIMPPSMLAIVGFLLLGVGLLWKGGIPRWAAVLMIVGSISYLVGVAGGAEIAAWQTKVLTPLASVAFLAALAPTCCVTGLYQAYDLEMVVCLAPRTLYRLPGIDRCKIRLFARG